MLEVFACWFTRSFVRPPGRGSASAPALAGRFAALLCLACGGADTTLTDPRGAETNALAPAGPTFGEHVSPIFQQKCVACHQPGGIGPFRLDDHATASAWGTRIVAATQARIMPPFLMETGGECGSFDESTALSDDQIATIAEWVAIGAPEGPPARLEPPPVRALATSREWATPLFTPEIQGGALAQFDEYRCFEIDLGLTEDTWITGFEVAPGNDRLIHHVVGFVVDPDAPALEGSNADAIARLRDAEPLRDGWPCFGAAGEGITVESVPVSWGPGTPPSEYPDGIGVRLRQGRKLIVQLHYNMASPGSEGASDQTRVRLQLDSAVERQAIFALPDRLLDSLAAEAPVQLPAGRASVPYMWTQSLADILGGPANAPLELVSVGAHMHERGRRWTLEVDDGSGFECVGRVNRWDFNWQRSYTYTQPPRLTDSSRLRLTCEYDTSGDSEPTLPGWGTRNEMCMGVLLLAFPPGVFF